jgi:hypothetical protein
MLPALTDPAPADVQRFTAVICIGPSVVRGAGCSGVAAAAQLYLGVLPLEQFAVEDPRVFRRRLKAGTQQLSRKLPAQGSSWGLARKCINLFLRDALYNHYLRVTYALHASEHLYELPLDSVVARGLKRFAGRGKLPMWPGLCGLTPEVSDGFQAVAQQLAAQEGIARVHLDLVLWTAGRTA